MVATYFAPADRASADSLRAARQAFITNDMAVAMLEAVPGFVAVLNPQRQIVAANQRFFSALQVDNAEAVVGLRPGEAVGCQYCHEGPGGCGTGKYCMHCGAVDAITECLRTHDPVTRECHILTRDGVDGGALDLEVQATFLRINGEDLLVLAMRDISAEKRRQLLERIFFHDVLNTATSLRLASQLLYGEGNNAQSSEYCRELLTRLPQQIIEEITAQQQLLAAEQHELELHYSDVTVNDVLQEVCDAYRQGDATMPGTVRLGDVPDCTLTTDVTLLRRVLGNLVKNALEALPDGGDVTVSARQHGDALSLAVQNPGVISDAVQSQIFKRSFSTKSAKGRGIGTYSVKLFTERYLGGQVTFTSREPDGTTFVVTIPRTPAPTGA